MESSIIAVKQFRTKTYLITRLELLTKCNDVWLNSYCYPIMQGWQDNMDMWLKIDMGKITDYMTKYIIKSEKLSNNNIESFSKRI